MEEIKLASVKFKSAGKIYYFSTNLKLKKDDRVVVETARGLELGEISQELNPPISDAPFRPSYRNRSQ